MIRGLLAGALILWWTVQTARYVPVWDTPQSLATHVVQMAPSKPRALVNYGAMLVLMGQLPEARATFHAAGAAAILPHVPSYDREMSLASVRTNLRAVEQLDARMREAGWRDPAVP